MPHAIQSRSISLFVLSRLAASAANGSPSRGGSHPGTHDADLTERLEVAQSETPSLPPPIEKPTIARCLRSAIVNAAVDHRDDVLEKVTFVERRISTGRPGALSPMPHAITVDGGTAVAQGHDDEKGSIACCARRLSRMSFARPYRAGLMIVRKPWRR